MNIRQVRQERDELAVRAEGIVETAIEEKRGLTDEQHAEHKRLLVQIDEHDSLIEAMEENAAKSEPPPIRREAIGTQTSGPSIPQEELTDREKLVNWIMSAGIGDGVVIGNAFEPRRIRDRMADGEERERHYERMEGVQRTYYAPEMGRGFQSRAQGISTDVAGGYLVDDMIANYIEKAMKQYGRIFNTRVMVIPTMNGAPFDYPTLNDTNNKGRRLGEGVKAPETDLEFANVTLGAYKYTSDTIVVSIEMLQDTAFDIEGLIFDCFAERIGRIVGEETVIGTGGGMPEGIVHAATAGVTLTAGSSTITYANVLALYGSTDPDYDDMGEWAFNKATKVSLMGVLDGDNRPLFRFDMTPDGPVAAFGSGATGLAPYTVIQEIPSQGNGNKFMLWGDFSKHKIRQVMGMQMYRQDEVYIDAGQLGFVAHARYDSRFIDGGGGAVKAMAQGS